MKPLLGDVIDKLDGMNAYFCVNCDRSHYTETKIGQRHKDWEWNGEIL